MKQVFDGKSYRRKLVARREYRGGGGRAVGLERPLVFPTTPKQSGRSPPTGHFAKNSPAPGPTGNPSAIQPISISVQAMRNATE